MTQTELCANCLLKPPAFDCIASAFLYQPPINHWIPQFKYQQRYYIAHWLTELWLHHTQNNLNHIDCLIPIPLHRTRLRQRGYNQAALLAACIGKALNVPVLMQALQKTHETTPQSQQSARQRQRLSANVFCAKPLTAQRIALVDDVMTTGSTLNAAASCLKEKGVRRVYGYVIARTAHI